jgi:hypothetical protein
LAFLVILAEPTVILYRHIFCFPVLRRSFDASKSQPSNEEVIMASQPTTTAFNQFCHKIGISFCKLDESTYLGIYQSRMEQWPVVCYMKDALLCFSSLLPIIVPDEKRKKILKYINQANWDIAIGNLEMNLADGEIRFRTSAVVDKTLSPLVVGALLTTNLAMTNHYLPSLRQVLAGNQQPTPNRRTPKKANAFSRSHTIVH